MKKLTAKVQKTKKIAAIETALAETRADITAGRVVKESAEAHVKRLKKIASK
ncbi:MAG: hypothetical protein AB1722_01050 [Pseudomonadota bacterium]|jgi:hypothetical protein